MCPYSSNRARRGLLALVPGVIVAAALWTNPAHALDVPKGKEGKGGGGGRSAPEGSSATSGQVDSTVTSRLTGSLEEEAGLFDARPGMRRKWFDVGIGFETHGTLWCPGYDNCASNAGARKLFNYFNGYASLLLTRNDRIRLRAGFYEFLLADQGESGVRATDLSLSYSHLFRLPSYFSIRGTAALTAPVSFYSQKASLITSPSASVSALYSHPRAGVSVDLSGFGSAYVHKCSSAGGYNCNAPGGAPNPIGLVGGSLELSYAFWFHKPLAVGTDGYVGWLWFHDVQSSKPTIDCTGTGQPCDTNGTTQDATFPKQPVQQVYGFEAFVRYSLPAFKGIHADLQVAVAEGDPTLGYVSRNIDGVAHFIGNYYQNFEAYGAVSARY